MYRPSFRLSVLFLFAVSLPATLCLPSLVSVHLGSQGHNEVASLRLSGADIFRGESHKQRSGGYVIILYKGRTNQRWMVCRLESTLNNAGMVSRRFERSNSVHVQAVLTLPTTHPRHARWSRRWRS